MFFSSASLVASLSAVAMALPSAVETRSNGCIGTVDNFNYTVAGFQYNASYIFSTPSHQNPYGSVVFDLVNPATKQTSSCSASSSQLQDFFYGNIVYTCTENDDQTSTKTTFTFNSPTNQINWNQTWSCADPTTPTTFTAYGAANMTTDRYETDYQNGNWSMGEFYSTKLVQKKTKYDLSIKPVQISAVA